MTPVRCVVSDFGGVLTSPLLHAFASLQDEAGIPVEALGAAMARAAAGAGEHPLFALERGEITEAAFLDELEDGLAAELGRPVSMRDFSERYFRALQPNEALFAYYRALRDRGIRLAMLTNNVREWEPRWRSMLPIDDVFELVVDSAFVGMRKPERGIYELTLERLGDGLRPEECLFVDDLEVNCEGARALGMTAVRFEHCDQALPELRSALGQ